MGIDGESRVAAGRHAIDVLVRWSKRPPQELPG
jgi:hypothetical protein